MKEKTASRKQYLFSGFFSQFLVVCVLTILIVLTVYAMFSTGGMIDELRWIGMTVTPLEPATAAAAGIPPETGGVIVGEVGGMARDSGVQHGDIVVGVNGKPVTDMNDFAKVTRKVDVAKGDTTVDVIRRGARVPILIAAGGVAGAPGALRNPVDPGAPPPVFLDRKWLGIDAETFAPGEAAGAGVPVGVGGVRIDGVTPGSRAERAGLEARDVIVSVNGLKVNSTNELWAAMGRLSDQDRVEFGVFRRGRLTSVVLPTSRATQVGGFPVAMGGGGFRGAGMLACPNCGTRVTPQPGVACFSVPCPACGAMMRRTQ
jgi:predicted metalloprotease with PDZ domain